MLKWLWVHRNACCLELFLSGGLLHRWPSAHTDWQLGLLCSFCFQMRAVPGSTHFSVPLCLHLRRRLPTLIWLRDGASTGLGRPGRLSTYTCEKLEVTQMLPVRAERRGWVDSSTCSVPPWFVVPVAPSSVLWMENSWRGGHGRVSREAAWGLRHIHAWLTRFYKNWKVNN
jgi:hypothetical protein